MAIDCELCGSWLYDDGSDGALYDILAAVVFTAADDGRCDEFPKVVDVADTG